MQLLVPATEDGLHTCITTTAGRQSAVIRAGVFDLLIIIHQDVVLLDESPADDHTTQTNTHTHTDTQLSEQHDGSATCLRE